MSPDDDTVSPLGGLFWQNLGIGRAVLIKRTKQAVYLNVADNLRQRFLVLPSEIDRTETSKSPSVDQKSGDGTGKVGVRLGMHHQVGGHSYKCGRVA